MKLKKINIAGAVFTLVAGTLLHFVYAWTGENAVAAAFAATNESVWEHLKLLWVPFAAFSFFEFLYYGRKRQNFLPVKIFGVLTGMAFMVTAFYTYSGILGRSILAVDILLFALSVAVTWGFCWKYMRSERFSSLFANAVARILAALTTVCFIVWSYSPPAIGIFRSV